MPWLADAPGGVDVFFSLNCKRQIGMSPDYVVSLLEGFRLSLFHDASLVFCVIARSVYGFSRGGLLS